MRERASAIARLFHPGLHLTALITEKKYLEALEQYMKLVQNYEFSNNELPFLLFLIIALQHSIYQEVLETAWHKHLFQKNSSSWATLLHMLGYIAGGPLKTVQATERLTEVLFLD